MLPRYLAALQIQLLLLLLFPDVMVVGALLPPIMTKQEWKERENVKGVLDYLTQNQYFIFNIIIIINICKS